MRGIYEYTENHDSYFWNHPVDRYDPWAQQFRAGSFWPGHGCRERMDRDGYGLALQRPERLQSPHAIFMCPRLRATETRRLRAGSRICDLYTASGQNRT